MARNIRGQKARQQDGGWGETTRTVVYAVLIALVVRTFAFEPFNIPSGSMIPTLLVGDYLFVSKYSYGYSKHSFPMSAIGFSGRIFETVPKRGDVAVFKYPGDQGEGIHRTDYIKRIIGLPGDTVQVKGGLLYINDKVVERARIDDTVQGGGGGPITRSTLYNETLPGGVTHRILEESDNERFDNTEMFKVPPGHVFVMGDNRDNSADSRSFLTFMERMPDGRLRPTESKVQGWYVPMENLVGRAEFLFFSYVEAGYEPGFTERLLPSWLGVIGRILDGIGNFIAAPFEGRIRWSRLGQAIR